MRVNPEPGQEAVTSHGLLGNGGNDLIYPTFAGDVNGKGLLIFSDVGPSQHVRSLAVGVDSNGQYSSSTTTIATSDGSLSQSDGSDTAFGDYSSTYPDPSVANDFWSVTEYVGTAGGTAYWKTAIGGHLHDQ